MTEIEVLGMLGMGAVALSCWFIASEMHASKQQRVKHLLNIIAVLFAAPVMVKIWIMGVMG